jgi:CRISPR-associated protein Cmr1
MIAVPRDWMLKALTPIWTGDANGQNGRLVPTGLLGSIRWWFEVVVRGFGGSACDPSPSDAQARCPDGDERHCVVCELFGCAAWARKFRFQVLDEAERTPAASVARNATCKLRFVPLRPIRRAEWALIDVTLRLIAQYGALGGKTVYKPSDEPDRQNCQHHQDYGLVEITRVSQLVDVCLSDLRAHVRGDEWRTVTDNDASWASLEHFWCVQGHYLARQSDDASTFNRIIGRPEPKSQASRNDSWLAGGRARPHLPPESKKVFSFKSPARTFGFVKPGTMTEEAMRQKLKSAWPDLKDGELVMGTKIVADMLATVNRT